MQGRVTEKTNSREEELSEGKKILQKELHCRAHKLYSPEGHLCSHFILEF